jgi:hypothetical protein
MKGQWMAAMIFLSDIVWSTCFLFSTSDFFRAYGVVEDKEGGEGEGEGYLHRINLFHRSAMRTN